MKKLLLLVAFVATAFCANAQTGEKSVLVKAGYETDLKRFGIGAEGRYNITDQIRLAPDLIFFFPKDHNTGLDINVNAHYLFPLQDGLSVYPLVGVQMANNRFSYQGFSNSSTEFGFNIGAGFDYNLSDASYVNIQFQYTFNKWDYALISLGYGIKF